MDEKNLPFHDALDHFVFLYFASAYQAMFAYIKKDDSIEGLTNEGLILDQYGKIKLIIYL